MKRLGRAPWGDVITESGLHQAELVESNAGDPAVGRVTDFRTDAVGGAEDAVVSIPPGLDLEMNSRTRHCGFDYLRINGKVTYNSV